LLSDYATARAALLDWTRQAVDAGWFGPQPLEDLHRLEQQQAEALFQTRAHRPLLVAFFGGTGVGKSSLLNRLAGAPIARTGLERPTSHEVTLYLHQDFQLGLLPAELPIEHTRIAYHHESGRRLLAWVDMPDMDSTAQENRGLVVAWLPYIDWIVYVVTPERYHDDLGWRFLQQRGQRHAWLFVMNHFDQGRPEQLEDFRRRLRDEGFSDPLLLRTSCAKPAIADDFPQLERLIQQAIGQHSLQLLQQLGLQARMDDLAVQSRQLAARLGDQEAWQQARQDWDNRVAQAVGHLSQNLRQQALDRIALLSRDKPTSNTLPDRFLPLAQALLGPRLEDQLEALNLQLANGLQAAGLPVIPFDRRLPPLARSHSDALHQLLLDQWSEALIRPGSLVHRGCYALNRHLQWLLPFAVGLWAIQHAVRRFYLATQGQAAFLGLDFILHSALLIALSWLLPYLLERQLRPGPLLILRQGINRWLKALALQLQGGYQGLWQQLAEERQGLLEALHQHFPPEQPMPNRAPGASRFLKDDTK
jgi:hypothetical protein